MRCGAIQYQVRYSSVPYEYPYRYGIGIRYTKVKQAQILLKCWRHSVALITPAPAVRRVGPSVFQGHMDDDGSPAIWESDDVEMVIVDAGCCEFRAGFAADEGPSVTRNACDRHSEHVWRDVLAELEVDLSTVAMVLTEPPGTSAADRATIAAILFTTLHVRALFFLPPPLGVAYGTDTMTGVVVDVGQRSTTIWAVYEGYNVLGAATTVPVGAGHQTDWLQARLQELGLQPGSDDEGERMAREAKEAHAVVALDYAKRKKGKPVSIAQPDGTSLSVPADEWTRCGEGLLQPQLIGLSAEVPGLMRALVETISLTAHPVQDALYTNVRLAGGGSMLNGLAERLQKELTQVRAPDR